MRIASNKLKDIIDFAYQELDLLYEKNEIRSMIYSLIEHFTEFDLTKILTHKDELKVSESELLKINFAIKDLKKEKPLQQIIGYTDFLDVRIDVNEHVLIPRVETEEIVQRVINENKGRKNLKIADICCGSGCIAIALKKAFPDANIYAYDISEEALKKSKENAEKNKEKINFFKENILESKEKNQEFDIIVSNPPYVRESEKAFMRNNVLLYEPALALFVSDKEPLIFYEHLLKFSNQNLAKNGKIYMEINENLAKETELLFKNFNYQTSVFKDLRGKDRLVFAKKDW
ncbi:MAG: peptide chain release factor N(5)-glutamine methyltransferase [Bacteroidales bacterium]|nr:peptide chain release factor N(5)-glutamine methyltransferase [Bacteroidales bacterium]